MTTFWARIHGEAPRGASHHWDGDPPRIVCGADLNGTRHPKRNTISKRQPRAPCNHCVEADDLAAIAKQWTPPFVLIASDRPSKSDAYHAATCRYLAGQGHLIPLRLANALGLTPCTVCHKGT